jgi:sulfur dioxygenase
MSTPIFRQLFDRESSTYTYLLADPDTREAALIDPVFAQADRDLEILRQLELELAYVMETHVHADHVTAAARLSEATGARIVASVFGPRCANLRVDHGQVVRIGRVALRVLATPGHTKDSVSYLWLNTRRRRFVQPIACSLATRC